uniref:Wsv321-like protein n=1 Tax=Metopaulias depressus WSSV-like virus TaxID=1675544 RepID=A0A0K0VL50_9VIRU|nr:wsv321-like protein [Metopaulias depressus WSSV-like virus]
MGFLAIIVVAVIAAVIVAVLFTMNSNYLDSNINTSLNLTEKLKLRGTFSPEDKKANNNILRNKLSTFVKLGFILDEMDRHNKAPTLINDPAVSDEMDRHHKASTLPNAPTKSDGKLVPPSPPVTVSAAQ